MPATRQIAACRLGVRQRQIKARETGSAVAPGPEASARGWSVSTPGQVKSHAVQRTPARLSDTVPLSPLTAIVSRDRAVGERRCGGGTSSRGSGARRRGRFRGGRNDRKTPVIGFLHTQSEEATRDDLRGFYKGLAEAGFVEGRNVAIVHRWDEGHAERRPALAAELVDRPRPLRGESTSGLYAGRILKGEKPATLPVILSTKYELIFNLKTSGLKSRRRCLRSLTA
jgi:hypothetical protein